MVPICFCGTATELLWRVQLPQQKHSCHKGPFTKLRTKVPFGERVLESSLRCRVQASVTTAGSSHRSKALAPSSRQRPLQQPPSRLPTPPAPSMPESSAARRPACSPATRLTAAPARGDGHLRPSSTPRLNDTSGTAICAPVIPASFSFKSVAKPRPCARAENQRQSPTLRLAAGPAAQILHTHVNDGCRDQRLDHSARNPHHVKRGQRQCGSSVPV